MAIFTELQQVLLNFAINAEQAIVQHGPAKRQVVIRTGDRDGWAWLEVEDSGPGVPPEHEAKLFQPFYTTKPVGEGTGLGLSVSYDIIRSHGGRIGYRRAATGGAVFFFELPIVPARNCMTNRLYYTEPYRTEFDATVVAVDTVDGRTHVTLDQTAFYPTSGGQPFDTGTLGGAAVSEVIDREDGTIAHVTSGSLKVGEVVQGAIDWARRFDHMQQHTGQHVLSAAFDRLFGVRTESFHMGTLSATIDLAREVTAAEVAKAEDEANRIVWEDRPVAIRFASAEEAATMPLRKESIRTGPLRLIDVEGVRPVGLRRHPRVADRRHWRDCRSAAGRSFAAARASSSCAAAARSTRFRLWRDSLAATQKFLSVAPEEMAAAVERMQGESKAQQRVLRGFQEKLAIHEAHALLAQATPSGNHLLVIEALDGWDAQGLKAIAVAAAAAAAERRRHSVLDHDSGAGRDRARQCGDRRCRRDAEVADREVWRQGWRQARPGPGWRLDGVERRTDCRRAGAAA